jgi:hypothetical protein
MPIKIYFPGTTYSQNKVAIKASFPKTCKWDTKGRKGWFGKDLNIIAHLRSGEPGTLYLEGKQEHIDAVVKACRQTVDSCLVEKVDDIPEFQPFEPKIQPEKQSTGIDLSPKAMMRARIQNEQVRMEACGMSENFMKKWMAIIEKEYEDKDNRKEKKN